MLWAPKPRVLQEGRKMWKVRQEASAWARATGSLGKWGAVQRQTNKTRTGYDDYKCITWGCRIELQCPNTKIIHQILPFWERNKVWLKFHSVKTQRNLPLQHRKCCLGFSSSDAGVKVEGECRFFSLSVDFIWLFHFRVLIIFSPPFFSYFITVLHGKLPVVPRTRGWNIWVEWQEWRQRTGLWFFQAQQGVSLVLARALCVRDWMLFWISRNLHFLLSEQRDEFPSLLCN